ncbi:fumarylacetoacetase [Paraburkholderia sp. 40]|uniref:fumarylacetoacetase n=1 Tax=Paraburkholderia sp. 40 TaxID=2991059 RepID=UPI003D20BE77
MSTLEINATHDPNLCSWVETANSAGADFPIQNLPLAVFRRLPGEALRCGIGIGDRILEVGACLELFAGRAHAAASACRAPTLNDLMALGLGAASALRARASQLLAAGAERQRETVANALHAIDAVELALPVRIGGFTDFFASVHHATNAGRLFRPDMPLLPNYKHVPIAYNGRANSVRVSGAKVQRPHGQLKGPADEVPRFAPAQRLDHEVELGAYIGTASTAGAPVAVDEAWRHIFGFSLLNDWSARDIQAWEYQPLGPFLAKSFATTVAPWVVTAEALAPFRAPAARRPAGDPAPLPYLCGEDDAHRGGLRIALDAYLQSSRMAEQGLPPIRLSRSGSELLYWTFAQMVAHHTSNGCALDTGDLLGSGTVSGADADALGSLLEITAGGSQPLTLPTGEQRTFLADGDELALTGRCEAPGRIGIGFGRCAARLVAPTS